MMLPNNSLSARLSKRITFAILALMAVLSIGLQTLMFGGAKRMYQQQVDIWVRSFPQTVLPHLIDSDHFSISSKVKLIASTELFSSISVTDAQKHEIAQFELVPSEKGYLPIQDSAGTTWGYFRYDTNFIEFVKPLIGLGLLSILIMIGLYFLIQGWLTRSLGRDFTQFNEFLDEVERLAEKIAANEDGVSIATHLTQASASSEEQGRINRTIAKLAAEIAMAQQRIREFMAQTAKQKTRDEVARIALQVAHDIRSPLSAVKALENELDVLPEETRLLVRRAVTRLNDIANQLLEKNRTHALSSPQGIALKPDSELASIFLLSSLLDELVSEKRAQYRNNANVQIELIAPGEAYGVFVRVQPTEFKSAISNLINNAVEALPQGEGHVVVQLVSIDSARVEVRIADDGKGIPPELLPELGNLGATFGKTGGSGMGLHHAQTCIQAWGGNLTIESKLGSWTKVTVSLRRAVPPMWFIPAIKILSDTNIVILDDDPSIHQVWRSRFNPLQLEKNAVITTYLSSLHEATKWLTSSESKTNNLFLIDLQFKGEELTGLDFIEQQGIAKSSILITSQAEDKNIMDRCERLGVKLIPKSMAGFVPLKVSERHGASEVVLIDDDTLVHIAWIVSARQHKKNLKVFKKPEDFLSIADEFDKATPIFIDSNLGDGVKGEEVARKIHSAGFASIYLSTGAPPGEFSAMPWIRKVVGKDPPWSIMT